MAPRLDVGTTMTVLLTTTLRPLGPHQVELHLEGPHPPWAMAEIMTGEGLATIIIHPQGIGATRHVTLAAPHPHPLGVTMEGGVTHIPLVLEVGVHLVMDQGRLLLEALVRPSEGGAVVMGVPRLQRHLVVGVAMVATGVLSQVLDMARRAKAGTVVPILAPIHTMGPVLPRLRHPLTLVVVEGMAPRLPGLLHPNRPVSAMQMLQVAGGAQLGTEEVGAVAAMVPVQDPVGGHQEEGQVGGTGPPGLRVGAMEEAGTVAVEGVVILEPHPLRAQAGHLIVMSPHQGPVALPEEEGVDPHARMTTVPPTLEATGPREEAHMEVQGGFQDPHLRGAVEGASVALEADQEAGAVTRTEEGGGHRSSTRRH